MEIDLRSAFEGGMALRYLAHALYKNLKDDVKNY